MRPMTRFGFGTNNAAEVARPTLCLVGMAAQRRPGALRPDTLLRPFLYNVQLSYPTAEMRCPVADSAVAIAADIQRTKLESFLGRKGSILIKVFHDLGALSGTYASGLELSTLRLFEPGNEQNCTEGIQILVRPGDREQGHTSFLDLDEVESLIAGLAYMTSCIAQSQGYRGDYTEMIFSTRGDFSVGFYLDQGKAQAFVKSAYDRVFIAPGTLPQLGSLLQAGKAHLVSTSVVRTA